VGWVLAELERRFRYGLDELARRFDRGVSWVSRRLALVEVLPEAIQQQVRVGGKGRSPTPAHRPPAPDFTARAIGDWRGGDWRGTADLGAPIQKPPRHRVAVAGAGSAAASELQGEWRGKAGPGV